MLLLELLMAVGLGLLGGACLLLVIAWFGRGDS